MARGVAGPNKRPRVGARVAQFLSTARAAATAAAPPPARVAAAAAPHLPPLRQSCHRPEASTSRPEAAPPASVQLQPRCPRGLLRRR